MKELMVAGGYMCSVSDEDHIFLAGFFWRLGGQYVITTTRKEGKRISLFMHKVVASRMGLIGEIDHKDRNKLNNQRSNLRIATRSQNNANRSLRIDNTSGYRGVCWDVSRSKWHVAIQYQDQTMNLGRFDNLIDAAIAYNNAAVQLFGEFAVLNEIP